MVYSTQVHGQYDGPISVTGGTTGYADNYSCACPPDGPTTRGRWDGCNWQRGACSLLVLHRRRLDVAGGDSRRACVTLPIVVRGSAVLQVSWSTLAEVSWRFTERRGNARPYRADDFHVVHKSNNVGEGAGVDGQLESVSWQAYCCYCSADHGLAGRHGCCEADSSCLDGRWLSFQQPCLGARRGAPACGAGGCCALGAGDYSATTVALALLGLKQ